MEKIKTLKIEFMQNYRRFRSYLGRPKIVTQPSIIVKEYEPCRNPIFLVGVHRSGTSLCRRIINSHSNIACPPETFFLEHFANMIRDEKTPAGMEGLGIDVKNWTLEIGKWASRYHEAYRLSQNKSRWADKTPQYVDYLWEIEEMFGTYVKYIMIYRHPLDVIYSIYKRGWNLANYDDNKLINVAKYVSIALEKQLAFEHEHSQKCHRIFYEKLTSQPDEILRNMFNFLEEPWEESVLNYHEFDHGFGTEDPIVKGTKGFLNNSGNWKCLPKTDLETILPIISNVIDKLGYEYE
jgi:hypothetical protein